MVVSTKSELLNLLRISEKLIIKLIDEKDSLIKTKNYFKREVLIWKAISLFWCAASITLALFKFN